MVKYYNAMVVFEEIPDEITLAINITNCPCRCPGCHSQFLWEDVGDELTTDSLSKIITDNSGVTCVCFMGGDANPEEINKLSLFVRNNFSLKTAWYSGMDKLSDKIDINDFDYIKIGHYDEKSGPLNKKTTNQRLYKVVSGDLSDITSNFWKN